MLRTDSVITYLFVGISPLEGPSHHQDRFDGSHTEIVVILLRKLL